MIKSSESSAPLGEVEALIHSAGRYVVASEDLRPRLLEAARAGRQESRAQRRIRQAVLIVVLSMVSLPVGDRRMGAHERAAAIGDPQRLNDQAAAKGMHCGGFGWGLVEAFIDLRREQSDRLDAAL